MAKYDSMRNIPRNTALLQYRQEYPKATLAEIGNIFNITPQRVWELLKNHEKNQTTEKAVV